MPVDLENKETNVFDLVIEEPKEKPLPFFVPERDITDEDWIGMWEELDLSYSSSCLAAIKTFNPDMFRDLNSQNQMYAFEMMKGDLDRGDLNIDKYASAYADAIQIYPDYFTNVNPSKFWGRNLWIDLNERAKILAGNGLYCDLFVLLGDSKIIFPGADLEIDFNAYKEKVEHAIYSIKDDRVIPLRDGMHFGELIFAYRVLFNKYPDIPIEKALVLIKKDMDRYRETREIDDFARCAMLLYYLSASDIHVGKNGIEVSFEEEEQKDTFIKTEKMPEVRSF